MSEIQLNEIAYDTFPVMDSDGNLVTGLIDGNFTKDLYNPSGSEVSGSITVTITELGGGNYKSSFTPNAEGNWLLIVYHATHFPTGKRASYECNTRTADIDAIDINTDELEAMVKRSLGLSQENFKMNNFVRNAENKATSYDITIYTDATMLTPLAVYAVTCAYDGTGNVSSYSVVKQ